MARPTCSTSWMYAVPMVLLACGAIWLPGCGRSSERGESASGAGETPKAAASTGEAGKVVTVTDANFAEVTSKGVVLVDLWSPRCPPCREQGPIVDKLAARFAGRAVMGKLEVDSNRTVPSKFRIKYIPTLIVFRDGKEFKRFTGLQTEAALASTIEKALAGN